MLSEHLLYASDFAFEAIAFDTRSGDGGSDAVFADLERMNAVRQHDPGHGRGHIAISLKLHNHELWIGFPLAGDDVLPHQIHIDGEALRLGSIDQRDTMKRRAQMGRDVRPCVATLGCHKLLNHGFVCRQRDAFFLGATFVILSLNLQKGQIRVHILTDTYLLAHQLPVVMADIHIQRGGVVIHGIVGGDTLAIDLLREIIRLRGL